MRQSGGSDLVSIRAAAKAIGIHHSVLAKQVTAGVIPSHDGKVRVAEVIAARAKFVNSRRRSPSPATPGASACDT
jgi:hypothetical protein